MDVGADGERVPRPPSGPMTMKVSPVLLCRVCVRDEGVSGRGGVCVRVGGFMEDGGQQGVGKISCGLDRGPG